MAKINESSTTVRFTISEISKLTTLWTQEVFLHGIPWQIKLGKYGNGTQKYLGVYLHCVNKDKSSNWTATANATVKLLPFGKDQRIHERHTSPFVYRIFTSGMGTNHFIDWNYLLNESNKYVKDDTAKFEIKIEADDPNNLSRSVPKFEYTEKVDGISCELSVANVKNLMSVRTPDFIIHDVPWYILATKYVDNLEVMLFSDRRAKNVSFQGTISAKLASSKDDVNPIEKSSTKNFRSLEIVCLKMISWKEMLKPKNGFVNGDSIKLIIEIKLKKLVANVGNVENVAPNQVALANRRRMNCSICSDNFGNQDISVTKCGHMFCTACIIKAIREQRICPSCKVAVKMNELRSLFLSA